MSSVTYGQGANPSGTRFNYTYDKLGRLTRSAAYSGQNYVSGNSQSFAYDMEGNMTSRAGVGGATYGYTGNLLTSVGSQRCTYDRCGRLLTDASQYLIGTVYNEIGLPQTRTHMVSQFSGLTFIRNTAYSADGVKLSDGYTETHLPVDDALRYIHFDNINYVGNLVLEGSNVVKTLFEGGYIDASGKYVFLLPDHLGNVMTATKADGARVQTFSYYPYGGTISAMPGTLTFTEEPYRFGGNEIDMFNNYDFYARWYNPAVGRFTMPDPLAEKYYSLSPYIYCADNPVYNTAIF